MQKAFVIHLHSGFGERHYDLMLQEGEVLATWRLRSLPVGIAPASGVPARRINDHRAFYLTYEGPVSNGRGEIKAVDRGDYELLCADALRRRVVFHGRVLTGEYELRRRREDSDEWTFGPVQPD